MGVTVLIFELYELKTKIKGVAMVTYCSTKLTAAYSAMTGQIFDTMTFTSTNIQWL